MTFKDTAKLVLGLGCPVLAFPVCILTFAAVRPAPPLGYILGFGILLLGFIGTTVAGTATAPLRPLRITLGFGMLIGLLLIFRLPLPPEPGDGTTLFILLSGLVCNAAAFGLPQKYPRLSLVALTIPAAWATYALVRILASETPHPPLPTFNGPSMVYALIFASFLTASWIAALWHGCNLWPSRPLAQPDAT